MGFISEFKEFAIKGNMIDLAVGIIIGGAFGRVVSSLVSDIIMPPIGLLTGGVNFKDLKWVLHTPMDLPGLQDVQPVTMNYGLFIQSVTDFLIVALSVFILVKGINRLRRQQAEESPPAAAPPAPTREETLLMEIRDLLKQST